MNLHVYRNRPGILIAGAFVFILAVSWVTHHVLSAIDYAQGQPGRLAAVWVVTFILLLSQTLLYHIERPRAITNRQARQLNSMHVSIIMPVYNEDPGYLKDGLKSFLRQTRIPNSVHIVDDGSTLGDYTSTRTWWLKAAHVAGIHSTWVRTVNQGKRHAQVEATRSAPSADIFITVDSDAHMAPDAIEQLLKPLISRQVQSVAGVVMASNHKKNLLSRITDLWFVTGQLVDRSSLSAMGSVLVNSGPLAAYRADVIRDNTDSYLTETFMNRKVSFSDDSLLTLYALLRGATVQQPSAVVFTAMPETLSHHIRQYLRWMRGSTIRSIWRMRYLPLNRWAYWAHLLRWFQMALSVVILIWLFALEPVKYGNTPPLSLLVIPFLIGYAQGLRYLSLGRSDETMGQRIQTWALMPLAVVWAWVVLRVIRWYGMLTCAKTGWGTRQEGAEVTLLTSGDTQELPIIRINDITQEIEMPEKVST